MFIPLKGRIPDAIAFREEGFLVEITQGIGKTKAQRQYQEAYGKDVPLRVFCFPPFRASTQKYSEYYGHHSWSKREEDFVLAKRNEGWLYSEIAKKLGVRTEQVSAKYHDMRKKINFGKLERPHKSYFRKYFKD